MTHTKDEALKLALEALEESQTNNDTMEFWGRKTKAITAIKQAIAAPVQEPVAWIRGSGLEMLKLENGGHATVYASEGMSNHSQPLYTTPPAQPAVPLTDEQIESLLPDDDTPMSLGEAFVKFARAIEAAHVITKDRQ
jgi:hypothetical protein